MSYKKKLPKTASFLQLLSVTVIVLSVFLISDYLTKKQGKDIKDSSAAVTLGTYSLYPSFWPYGSYNWTAKRYFFVQGSGTYMKAEHDWVWLWSGPYDNGYRQVIYQKYLSSTSSLLGTPLDYGEWEAWKPDGSSAIVYRYGGVSSADNATGISYKNKKTCEENKDKEWTYGSGNIWPNAVVGGLAYYVESLRDRDGVCTNEYTSDKGGGYVAVKGIEDWGVKGSATRINKCNAWFPTTFAYGYNFNTPDNHRVNKICKDAAGVGVFQNRYAGGYKGTDLNTNSYGCEMVIYAWGYSSRNATQWFRNGMLRYTNYKTIISGTGGKVSPSNDDWWAKNCYQGTAPNGGSVWNSVPNWFYSGVYRLNNNTPVVDSI